ncbi:MAG: hypothetical protein ACOCXA_01610 [Planctomycetota bacterium]
MRLTNTLLVTVSAGLLCTAAAAEENPYAKPDDSWISISGTVANPTADSFVLDYGDGTVVVEMDDWDWYGDAYDRLDGDRVTVYGEVDDDLFEATTIEASSVYVENLNSYFYASSADEEDYDFWTVSQPIVLSQTIYRGTVSSVDPVEGEFTVDTGNQRITVETEHMLYDPLDEVGYQQIEAGDVVSVSGQIDYDFFEGRVLDADSIVTLLDNDAGS